ncbi:MAG: diacylglycerol/lipid kinase family protein [Acutalibacteraceae bacterium]|jgi:diacylglycerol kinase (ATP)
MKTIVLFNKKSGNGSGEERAQKVRAIWPDKKMVFEDVTAVTDMPAFLAGLDADDEVLLCGGDGTLNHFANDIDGVKLTHDVYYYPTGSGNDFWRDLDLDENAPPHRINQYLVDLPAVTVKGKTCRFLNGIGYGIDGYCCEEGDRIRATSDKPINYTSIAIKGLLFHYKPTTATVTVDGKTTVYKKAWLAPTMNGRFFGGGMMATPGQKRLSNPKKVTSMVMNGAGRLRTLIAFPKIFTGEHVKLKLVHVTEGDEVSVSFDRPVALQIDSETILDVSGYTVSVHAPAKEPATV